MKITDANCYRILRIRFFSFRLKTDKQNKNFNKLLKSIKIHSFTLISLNVIVVNSMMISSIRDRPIYSNK